MLSCVVVVGPEPDDYIPAFTSSDAAKRFIDRFREPEKLEVFAFSVPAKLGAFLNAVPQTHIAFDPEPPNANRRPIRDVADELYRYIRGPLPN